MLIFPGCGKLAGGCGAVGDAEEARGACGQCGAAAAPLACGWADLPAFLGTAVPALELSGMGTRVPGPVPSADVLLDGRASQWQIVLKSHFSGESCN